MQYGNYRAITGAIGGCKRRMKTMTYWLSGVVILKINKILPANFHFAVILDN